MAIQFARCEYVSRSTGGNACRKAAYNQREVVKCERTGELFSFKERGGNVHHEILLPLGADAKFRSSSVLWNEAEKCELRKNSQVAKELVVALPDDKQITFEDRVELSRRFAQANFVDKGVAVQVDLHEPDAEEKNWHAHLLVTTRRFSEDGQTFSSLKARDLDPVVRSKMVMEADLWGEIWRDVQNTYFEEKGYDIQVDHIGILAQEHLGPVRMRHHMNQAIARSQELRKANETLAHHPEAVLEALTRHTAVFTERDLDLFLKKHVPEGAREGLREDVLGSLRVLPLYDKATGTQTSFFTTQEVRAEEEKLLRFADGISHKTRSALSPRSIKAGLSKKPLSNEQKDAYDLCVTSNKNLAIIQGRAGVGKSYVVDAIRRAHEEAGFRVLGLAPTHKVATALKESGFQEAKTCHSFLFAFKNNRDRLDSNTLVVVEEAGMMGSSLSVELFNAIKKKGAKLILVGDDRQLSSVERPGAFGMLAERYGAAELQEVRRQTINWQKTVSEDLSKGDIKSAVSLLQDNNCISWQSTKEEALIALLKEWAKGSREGGTRQILAQRNVDVDALNAGARESLRAKGKLGELEITCMTQRGKVNFAEGDRVQLTKTDKAQGLENGSFGVIEHINPETKIFTLKMDNKETKEVDPTRYDGLRHGYAATVYKAQGSTLDHVYVLHGKTTNQSTNYVALTRQTTTLSLYVSKDETPTESALIYQMGRSAGKGTSLAFDTEKDIERKQTEKSLSTKVKQGVETLVTKVKDTFHKNEDFYKFERSQQKKEEVTLSSSVVIIQNKSFQEIRDLCERRLYRELEKEGDLLTENRKERFPLQAERTATFLMHSYREKGINPTQEEIRHLSLRAKYELKRIPETRQALIEQWTRNNSFKKNEGLLAHMIAERLASIEGRLYLEAQQKGSKLPLNIAHLAREEFESHKDQTPTLANNLTQHYALSKTAATHCAKDILRARETHGEDPSSSQIGKMVKIALEFEKRDHNHISKCLDSSEIDFLRRKEGDLMMRETSSHDFNHESSYDKFSLSEALRYVQNQIRTQLKEMEPQLEKESSMAHEKERSYDMSI